MPKNEAKREESWTKRIGQSFDELTKPLDPTVPEGNMQLGKQYIWGFFQMCYVLVHFLRSLDTSFYCLHLKKL